MNNLITVCLAVTAFASCQKELTTSELGAKNKENSYTNPDDSVVFSQNLFPDHDSINNDERRTLIADSFYVNFDSCMLQSAALTITGGAVSKVKMIIDNQHIDSVLNCDPFNEFTFTKGYWITKGWHFIKFKGQADCAANTQLTCSLPEWSLIFSDEHGVNEGLDQWAVTYGLPLSKTRIVK